MGNEVFVSNSITFRKKMKYYEVKSVLALFSHEKRNCYCLCAKNVTNRNNYVTLG